MWLGLLALLPLVGRAQELPDWPAHTVPHTLLDSIRYLQTRGVQEAKSNPAAGRRTDQAALRLAQRLGDLRVLSICWRQLGDRDYTLGTETVRCYEQALAAARQARWPQGQADAYLGLGQAAYDHNDFRRALRLYAAANREFARVPVTPATRAEVLRDQLLALANQQNATFALPDVAGALRLGRQALALRAQALATAPDSAWRRTFRYDIANVSGNILSVQVDAYRARGQLDSARRSAALALRLTPGDETEASLRTSLAEIELSQGRPRQALAQVQQAARLARRGGYLSMLQDALEVQPRVLYALHRSDAYDSLRAYVALHDTLTSHDRLDAIAQAQARFDSREQQAQIVTLQQRNRLATQAQELGRLRTRQERAGLGVLAAGLLLGVGWSFQHYRRRQAAARAAAAQALRQRLAADLHDDVGNLLTQISMQSSLLREAPGSPEQLLARLDQLSATSRQATQHMSDVVRGLSQPLHTLPELLEHMSDHAHEVLYPLGIEVDFGAHPAAVAATPSPETLHSLYLIYKEALHNVVKHARATRVTIRLAHSPAGLRLSVADDGQGHTGTARPGGHGLRNMQARAQAVGGSMQYEPLAPGFRVVVELPAAVPA
jgi:signal transduction histidine kinase